MKVNPRKDEKLVLKIVAMMGSYILIAVLLVLVTSSQGENTFDSRSVYASSILVGTHEIILDKYFEAGELDELMKQLGDDYSSIVKTFSIGPSGDKRSVWAARISRDVQEERATLKPMVKLVANVHGADQVGYGLMVSLIQYLVYGDGADDRISGMLNTTDIWIIPTLNPDVLFCLPWMPWVNTTDCRNQFTSTWIKSDPDEFDLDKEFLSDYFLKQRYARAMETKGMMNLIMGHPFVLSANFRAGAIVANYPFDFPLDLRDNSESILTPDNMFFVKLAKDYAKLNRMMASGSACNNSFSGGITNGHELRRRLFPPSNKTLPRGMIPREQRGSLQDINYRLTNCFEISLYLSCRKDLPSSELPEHWWTNLESMLQFIDSVHQGIYGLVKDTEGNRVEDAVITVEGNDKEIEVAKTGEYWRLLVPDVYDVTVSAPGYEKVTKKVNLTVQKYVQLDFNLTRSRQSVFGTVKDVRVNPIEESVIELDGKTVKVTKKGRFSSKLMYLRNYKLKASAPGYVAFIDNVSVTWTVPYCRLEIILRRVSIYGKIRDEYGNPIEGSVIRVKTYQESADGKEVEVKKNGEYSVMLSPSRQNINLAASAPKYKNQVFIMHFDLEPVEHDFRLLPLVDVLLYGTVLGRNKKPVDETVIKVSGKNNELDVVNGEYSITLLQGRYNVTASAPGYKTEIQNVDLLNVLHNFSLNFDLKKSKLQLIPLCFRNHALFIP